MSLMIDNNFKKNKLVINKHFNVIYQNRFLENIGLKNNLLVEKENKKISYNRQ